MQWLVVLILCSFCVVRDSAQSYNDETIRDKRTIDVFIRGIAETFGYDVQKRPSVLTPAAPAPAALTAPKSTFFPPPVAPLPRNLPGPPNLTIRWLSRAQAPAAPAAAVPAAPAPPAKPSKPMPAMPVMPPPPPAKKPPLPAPAAAPAPVPKAPAASNPRPLLRENISKTFNIAFNINRDVNTVAPPPTAAAAPAPAATTKTNPPGKAPRPSPTPAMRGILRPPPAKPAPTLAPKPTPPPKPPMPITLPPVATPKTPVKPQLYQDDYEDYDDRQNLEQEDSEPVSYDYKNYLKDEGNKKDPNKDFDDSKERFKQHLETFWAGAPYLQHIGYKYLAANPEQGVEPVPHEEIPLQNKYEEYEVLNENYQEPPTPRTQQQQQKFILYKSDYVPDDEENQELTEEDAEESQKQTRQQKPCKQEVVKDKNKEIVNKIITDFKEFERKRKNQPPLKEEITPIKLREQEREKQRLLQERKQRTKEAIHKQIYKGRGFVEPAFSGVIRAPLQELYQADHKAIWPIPFDIDQAASQMDKEFRRINREAETINRQAEAQSDEEFEGEDSDGYKGSYQEEHYEAEADYKEPEPTKYDYSQIEKLHLDDDKELSANAKIQNTQYGQRTVRVNANERKEQY